MKRPPKFYAMMSFLCLRSIKALRLMDIGVHTRYFIEYSLFLFNLIAHILIGWSSFRFFSKRIDKVFLEAHHGVFSIGFIALDPDLVLVLTSRFKPDIPLILLFTLSPVLSTLLCLFSYWGYKSLDVTVEKEA